MKMRRFKSKQEWDVFHFKTPEEAFGFLKDQAASGQYDGSFYNDFMWTVEYSSSGDDDTHPFIVCLLKDYHVVERHGHENE